MIFLILAFRSAHCLACLSVPQDPFKEFRAGRVGLGTICLSLVSTWGDNVETYHRELPVSITVQLGSRITHSASL
jgi:hypothetical protein